MVRFLVCLLIWFGVSMLSLAPLNAQECGDQIVGQSTEQSDKQQTTLDDKLGAGEGEDVIDSRPGSAQLLPLSTRAWFSIPDTVALEVKFDQTQLGQMFQQDEVRPFFDDTVEIIKKQLDEKNVRIGLSIEDIVQIRVGEVCVAGVFQDLDGGQPARGSHGLVLLVDVADNEANVEQVLDKLNKELAEQPRAAVTKLQMGGLEVTQISVDNPKRIRHSRNTYHIIHGGWLLIADNEEIFRDILGRIVAPEQINHSLTLSRKPDFLKIMAESSLLDSPPDISWYIDPVGYLELVHKIRDEEQEIRTHKEDWTSKLKEIGFDAIAGIGGNIGIGLEIDQQEFEILSRIFVYAPRQNLDESNRVIFDLFDFTPAKPSATTPGELVGDQASGFFGGSWNFTSLLNGIGPIYDIVVGNKEQASFEKLLNDLAEEPDLQVDVRKIISMLDNQIFFMSEIEKPIEYDSEHVAVCVPLNETADAEFIFKSLSRAAKGNRGGDEISLGGIKVIEVDTTQDDDFHLEEEFRVPGLDLDPQDEPQKRLVMFEKRYITVHNGYLLVVNNKRFMRKILSGQTTSSLSDSDDYQQVADALAEITDSTKVAFRRFARNDQIMETNYQMLRQGEMASAQTLIARVINHILENEASNGRAQQFNGELLPEDYDAYIAPFLGPNGWVVEVEDDGWRITGCALRKK